MQNDMAPRGSAEPGGSMADNFELLRERRLKRRGVLTSAGIGAAAVGAFAAGALRSDPAEAATSTDLAVLNFALNLEYLEAEFYQRAAFGTGLSSGDNGNSNATITAPTTPVNFLTRASAQYAAEIAQDELNHVRFLRSAITAAGSTPVAEPAIDLINSFNTAAVAAGLGSSFNPYADEVSFLLGAFVFEDVGVTAYCGALAALSNTYVTPAGQIMAVEAYHAAEIRTRLYQAGQFRATSLISALRASASNAADDQGISVNGQLNIVPTDSNSLVYTRTTSQVLSVVYLGGAAGTGGGFFPSGMNGAIR